MRIRDIRLKIREIYWRCRSGRWGFHRIKRKYRKNGKVNLYQGLKDWIEDERMAGRIEGLIEGLTEGRREGETLFINLTKKLLEDGRMEDLLRAIEDKEYREKLYSRYRFL